MKTTNCVTYEEALKGVPFKRIESDSLPIFNENDYSLPEGDRLYTLVSRLRNVALQSLPTGCEITNYYSGILATDLFSLNTLLGSMIESKVVSFLNSHRELWDTGKWSEYHFIRSNESFPDVRLVERGNPRNVIMGIELKSWFLLSKEGEPSFRYRTASEACEKSDLLCIVPWYLSDAVCGTPKLTSPWIYPAKAASEATKRYWELERQTESALSLDQRGLIAPVGAKPYMENARDKTNYKPVNDGGNNFGRLARTGIMSSFVEDTLKTDILGIPADNWRLFLKAHSDSNCLKEIHKRISAITRIPKSEEFNKLLSAFNDYFDLNP